MKKIIFLLALFLSSFICYSQGFPQYQHFGSPTTRTAFLGAADAQKGLINGRYVDTTTANLGYIDAYAGSQIFTTGNNTVWVRNSTATAWISQGTINPGTSVTTISILNDSLLIYCTGAGVCDTFIISGGGVNNAYFISDTQIVYCFDPVLPPADSCLVGNCDPIIDCDTLTIPGIPLYIYQNGLREVAQGIREFGVATIDSDPNSAGPISAWLQKRTTLNTSIFDMTFTGFPYWSPVTNTYQQHGWGASTLIASFRSRGTNIDTTIDYNNPSRWSISYTGRTYGDVVTQIDTGYMGDKIGYFTGTNLYGISSYGMQTDNVNSKYSGIFYHTLDIGYKDVLTFYGASPPVTQAALGPLRGAPIMSPSRILTLGYDKSAKWYGYGDNTFLVFDTTNYKPLVVDANGDMRKSFWAGGGGGPISFTDGNGFDGTVTGGNTLSLTTSLTTGRVPYVGASGALTEDGDLMWNDFANVLGLGNGISLNGGTGSVELNSPSASVLINAATEIQSVVGTTIFDLNLNGRAVFSDSRVEETKDEAIAAEDLAISTVANLFEVSGSDGISAIDNANDLAQPGTKIGLRFLGSPLLVNEAPAFLRPMRLAGRVNFQASEGDYIEFRWDGEYWYETNRVLAGAVSSGVTNLTATDANGFDFTITDPTTTPNITLTTNVTDDQVMVSNSGAVSGSSFLTVPSGVKLQVDGTSTGGTDTYLQVSDGGSNIFTVSDVAANGIWSATLNQQSGGNGPYYDLRTAGTLKGSFGVFSGDVYFYTTGAGTDFIIDGDASSVMNIQIGRSANETIILNTGTRSESTFLFKELPAPSAATSGYTHIYVKTDGLFYGKDDAGVETKLSNDANGTVTSFAFTDGNGFDGTVTSPNSTPTLSLTTTVSNTHVMYSNSGAITGSANFTWDNTIKTLAVFGGNTGTNTIGYFAQTSSGYTLEVDGAGGTPLFIVNGNATTNSVLPGFNTRRDVTGGSGTAGLGISWGTTLEASDGTPQAATGIVHEWTTATISSQTAKMYFTLVNAGSSATRLTLEGDGRLVLTGRLETDKGADVASANDLTLGADGNVFVITGTTTINAITTTNWQAGSVIILIFTGATTVKHNTAGGAGTARIFLAGSIDLTTANHTTLTLAWDGTQFQEISRKIP